MAWGLGIGHAIGLPFSHRAGGGGSGADIILGTETDGLAFSAADDSLTIKDTVTPVNNFKGAVGAKFTTTRAGIATYYNSSGLIANAAANTLRRDYDPRLGGAAGYLVEEARTNIVPQSNFAGGWSHAGTIRTFNAAIAPDGTNTAIKLINNDPATVEKNMWATGMTAAATTYTQSVFAKAAEYTWLYVRLDNGTANGVWFDLANGVVGTQQAGLTGKITNVGNGWYRCEVTGALLALATYAPANLAPSNGVNTHGGTVGNGLYLWGVQLEVGTFATSYIPTVGAAVTRAGDTPTIATSLFPYSNLSTSFYIQAQGEAPQPATMVGGLSENGSSNNMFQIRAFSAAHDTVFLSGGALQSNLSIAGVHTNKNKLAFAAVLNDTAFVVNGSAPQLDTTIIMPVNINQLNIGGTPNIARYSGWIFEAMYLPRRMSNAELQAITTIVVANLLALKDRAAASIFDRAASAINTRV